MCLQNELKLYVAERRFIYAVLEAPFVDFFFARGKSSHIEVILIFSACYFSFVSQDVGLPSCSGMQQAETEFRIENASQINWSKFSAYINMIDEKCLTSPKMSFHIQMFGRQKLLTFLFRLVFFKFKILFQ